MTHKPATDRIEFALTGNRRIEGDHAIYPMAMLFHPGDYKDKNFTMSPEELWLAADTFEPVTGNIEHTDFLKGRACEVRRVWLSDDGDNLHGEVAVPLGLDDLLEPQERRLSCEWHRDTKALTGMALVVNPRVADAALMSKAAATFSGDDLDAFVTFAGKRHSKTDQHLINTGHAMAHAVGRIFVGLGAAEGSPQEEAGESPDQEAAEDAARMHKGDDRMADEQKAPTRMEKFFAWLGGDGEAQFTEEAPATSISTTSAKPAKSDTVDFAAMRAENEALKARMATQEQERIHEKALAFADEIITGKRAVPAERETIIAAFKQAANDDLAHPQTVTFADGTERTRLDVTRAQYQGRPVHMLTDEMLKDPQFVALYNKATEPAKTDAQLSEDERKNLLGLSPLGRVALSQNGK